MRATLMDRLLGQVEKTAGRLMEDGDTGPTTDWGHNDVDGTQPAIDLRHRKGTPESRKRQAGAHREAEHHEHYRNAEAIEREIDAAAGLFGTTDGTLAPG